ncbi:hypothetical protein VitviT2T_024991 [Vitis vinifera]|uniref:F-box domain-containing protein n=2 Tax=Vitis vinifera TaxID=29760 RepID=A0ABY9DHE6_VITVI|nr:F-box protein At4g00755 [Vitis vinifera]XP_010662516.1 F-box protein At4g00755 [Vitis vinifera]WKA07129.1 hypothetical protein VitviT2T_024991 [Vitis vinifera]|eukprot:XP_002279638.1 PREDICTED: F-box protein At4g00755 isoform X1 [Vitis vinifera]
MPVMGDGNDFIRWLGRDMSIKILMCLEDPSDLVRVSTVSRLWRQFVIENGLSKQLCLRMLPEMSSLAGAIEINNMIETEEVQSNNMERKILEKNHRVYAYLAQGLTSSMRTACIARAISASSTDNYPEETIDNTLDPRDRIRHSASYWSSEGEMDPSIPESLVYKLIANLCVVTEIHVQPFQAYFQFGHPIYSAKAVRFRMGHQMYPMERGGDAANDPAAGFDSLEDQYIWTYTSPEFPMAQENRLQKFKLPEPALCIGGILQIELLGRVQKQEMDGLYYICVSHVQVVGRPLSEAFDVEIHDPSGKFTLKYFHRGYQCQSPVVAPEGLGADTASWMQSDARSIEQIIERFLGAAAEDDSDDDYLPTF